MSKLRRLVAVTLALAAALSWAPAAHAAGGVNINSCRTLDSPNTTYTLTVDLSTSGDCLVVAADRITIDLRGTRSSATGQAPASPTAASRVS
jgi:hypothetical protein